MDLPTFLFKYVMEYTIFNSFKCFSMERPEYVMKHGKIIANPEM